MDKKRERDADEAITIVLEAAARQVSAEGCTVEVAVRHHLRVLHDRWPHAWALVAERLHETGNAEMLAYMEESPDD